MRQVLDCHFEVLETRRLNDKTVYIGENVKQHTVDAVTGGFVTLAGEPPLSDWQL